MSDGTRPGLLLAELLAGDGPHIGHADRFVVGECSGCGVSVNRESQADSNGLWCIHCWVARKARR